MAPGLAPGVFLFAGGGCGGGGLASAVAPPNWKIEGTGIWGAEPPIALGAAVNGVAADGTTDPQSTNRLAFTMSVIGGRRHGGPPSFGNDRLKMDPGRSAINSWKRALAECACSCCWPPATTNVGGLPLGASMQLLAMAELCALPSSLPCPAAEFCTGGHWGGGALRASAGECLLEIIELI